MSTVIDMVIVFASSKFQNQTSSYKQDAEFEIQRSSLVIVYICVVMV